MRKNNHRHDTLIDFRSNAFCRETIDQIRDIVLVVDRYGNILNVNKAAIAAYGYCRDELLDMRVHDLRSPETRAIVDAQLKVAQREGTLFRTVHIRRTGEPFPVEVNSRCFRYANEETVVSVVRDITEAVAMEAELIAGEEKYRRLHKELSTACEKLSASEEELKGQFDMLQVREEAIRRQNLILASLHQTALELMKKPEFNDVLELIVSKATELLGTEHGFIRLVDEEKGVFTSIIGLGYYAQYTRDIKITQGLSGQVYRTGKIAIVDDYSTWEHRIPEPFFDHVHSIAHVPLKAGDKVIGTFGVAYLTPERKFSDQDIAFFSRFADLASIAVKNAQLLNSLTESERELQKNNEKITAAHEELLASQEELRQQFDELLEKEEKIRQQNFVLTSVHEMALGLMHRLEPDEVLRMIVASAAQLLGTPDGYISLVDETEAMFVRKVAIGRFCRSMEKKSAVTAGLLGQAFLTGRIAVVNDYNAWDNRLNDPDYDDLHCCAVVPLKVGEKVIGAFGLVFAEPGRTLAENEIFLLQRFADMASVALDNATLISSYRNELSERRRAEEAIKRMAYHDALTGLPNRLYLEEFLDEEMEKARRGEAAGAIMFIDLDDLKMINDTFGHSHGDSVIVKAGECIVAEAGGKSIVARIGGDEFIVVLPGRADSKRVRSIADGIVKLLERDYEVSAASAYLSASVGVALYPEDGDTARELLKNADLALYEAKRSGKNTARFYEANMHKIAYENMVLKQSLREAVKRQELSLCYQPVMDARKSTVAGFEALLRWTSSELGPVPPGRFIPLAEESDTIQTIGKWVFREACKFARKLSEMERSDIRVSVNVSPRQLAADDFVAFIRESIAAAGIRPDQIEIEITENVLISSLEEIANKLRTLKAFGVHLTLDDFGRGYCSLLYLKNLPVETLKIDKSFIDQIDSDEAQLRFVNSIVNMAHIQNLAVVAEGVETQEQLAKLRNCRFDYIQGYLYSRPITEGESISLITVGSWSYQGKKLRPGFANWL
jgi:diguanylate cyclase (GGDEF)-like protein/PAS domain S-box-containing protein